MTGQNHDFIICHTPLKVTAVFWPTNSDQTNYAIQSKYAAYIRTDFPNTTDSLGNKRLKAIFHN